MRLASDLRQSDDKLSYVVKIGLPPLVVLCIALCTGWFFSHPGPQAQTTTVVNVACRTNGEFRAEYRQIEIPWDRWDTSLFLSVTLGFGNYSYATAKAIDVCWDLLVGRGGQLMLALLAYPVLRRCLMGKMERRSVALPVYTSLAFDNISLRGLRTIFCGQAQSFDWQYSAYCVVFIYILAFPTLVSIMTGYQTKYTPMFESPLDSSLVATSRLVQPDMVILDGSRVGLSDNVAVYRNDSKYVTLRAYWTTSTFNSRPDKIPSAGQELIQSCIAPEDYYLDSPHTIDDYNCSLTLRNDPRAHLIASSDLRWYMPKHLEYTSSNITLDGRTFQLSAPPLETVGWWYTSHTVTDGVTEYLAFDDTAISVEYLKNHGRCEPSRYYEWGFSWLLLFLFCVFSAVFATTMTALHNDAFWRSRADRLRYSVNHYRDAVDIVNELQAQLGDSVQNSSAKGLGDHVKKSRLNIGVETAGLPVSRGAARSGNGGDGDGIDPGIKSEVA